MHKGLLMLIVLLAGCRGRSSEAPAAPKLKTLLSTTDALLSRRYFEASRVESTPPADNRGQYVSLTYMPGAISIEPLTVQDLTGKLPKLRGARITLVSQRSVISGGSDRPEVNGGENETALLDDDELIDMVRALEYMKTTADIWAKQKSAVDTELTFISKDKLEIALYYDQRPTYLCKIGSTSLVLTPDQAATLRANVQKTIETVKAG